MKTVNDRVNPFDCAAYVLFAILAGIILLTFRDYGVNSDEIAHVTNGHVILDYYRTLFAEGLSPATHAFYQSGYYQYEMYRYGGLVDAFATAIASAMPLRTPLHTIETWHLILALIGLFGVVGCWKLARWIAGPRAALGAAVMLTLVPAYYGHMFNNPKDVPFAAFFVWGVYYIVRLAACEVSAPWSLTLRAGLAMGACMGVRFGGAAPAHVSGLFHVPQESDDRPAILAYKGFVVCRGGAACCTCRVCGDVRLLAVDSRRSSGAAVHGTWRGDFTKNIIHHRAVRRTSLHP